MKEKKKLSLAMQIFIALVLAIIAACLCRAMRILPNLILNHSVPYF